MVTETGRVVGNLQRGAVSLAGPDQPNSIRHLEPALNEFFGWYSDDRLISEVARIVPDENSADIRHAVVELISPAWEESGMTSVQRDKVTTLFRRFYLKAGLRGIVVGTYTIGQLRDDCEKHRIRAIPGLGETTENFLAGVVRKRTLQVLQGGQATQK
jgi:hypothetical protein